MRTIIAKLAWELFSRATDYQRDLGLADRERSHMTLIRSLENYEAMDSESSKHSSHKRYGKGCAIYAPWAEPTHNDTVSSSSKSTLSDTDTLDSGFESDHSTASHSGDHSLSWLDLGAVPSDFVRPEELEKNFGSCYVEGCSVPRRFSIRVKAESQVPICVFAVFTASSVHSSKDVTHLR